MQKKPCKTVDFGARMEQNPAFLAVLQKMHKGFPDPDGNSDGHSDVQTVGQTVNHPVRRSFRPLSRRSDRQTVIQTVTQTVGDVNALHDPIYTLTRNHGRVLLFLMQQNGVTQRQAISNATNIPFGTVKDALSILAKRGFISKPTYYSCGQCRGISFVVNSALCNDFLVKRGHEFQTVTQTVGQTVIQTVGHPDGQITSYSSSSKKLTTNNSSRSTYVGNPEMAYWLDTGLQERQASAWAKEFGMSLDELVQQLAWARWDLVENGKESGVQNVISWVYGVLKRTGGCYPRPDSYLSLEEKRLHDIESEISRREQARQEIETKEKELLFQRIMDDPDGETYQLLLDKVGTFAKECKGRVLETALREVFMNENGGTSSPGRQIKPVGPGSQVAKI